MTAAPHKTVRTSAPGKTTAGAAKPRRAVAQPAERLLVVIDASQPSKRMLNYVGRLAGGSACAEVELAYLEPHLPARLLESGGAESPEREEAVEASLRAEQRTWISASNRNADEILRSARIALERAGVAASRIHTCTSSPLDVVSAADEVLLLAHDARCRTIVVGHRAHGWFRGATGAHLAEQLVRKAKGETVWVVE